MKILVTRPATEAVEFAGFLEVAGFEPVISPVIEIELSIPEALPHGMTHFAVTSKNGCRVMELVDPDRSHPVFAVGPKTAQSAADHGFSLAGVGGSSIESLVQVIASHQEAEMRVLYLSGEHVSGNLVKSLSSHNVFCERMVVYHSHKNQKLTDEAHQSISQNMLGGATFFSRRTAEAFLEQIERENLQKNLKNLPLVCLSQSIANVFEKTPAQKIFAAKSPDQGGMIDILLSLST